MRGLDQRAPTCVERQLRSYDRLMELQDQVTVLQAERDALQQKCIVPNEHEYAILDRHNHVNFSFLDTLCDLVAIHNMSMRAAYPAALMVDRLSRLWIAAGLATEAIMGKQACTTLRAIYSETADGVSQMDQRLMRYFEATCIMEELVGTKMRRLAEDSNINDYNVAMGIREMVRERGTCGGRTRGEEGVRQNAEE